MFLRDFYCALLSLLTISESYYSSPKGIANHFSLCRITDNRPPTFFLSALIVVHIGHSECYVRVAVGGVCLYMCIVEEMVSGTETEVCVRSVKSGPLSQQPAPLIAAFPGPRGLPHV